MAAGLRGFGAFGKCCMRLLCILVAPPSGCRLLRPFSSIIHQRPFRRLGSFIMTGLIRTTVLCVALSLGLVSASAADKPFKRNDLADSAIRLEAKIKSEAGAVTKNGT